MATGFKVGGVDIDQIFKWGSAQTNDTTNFKINGTDISVYMYSGSGAMPTIGIDGKIYPCFRWLPASMNRDVPEEFLLGNVEEGLINKLGFISLEKATGWEISDEECRKCQIQSACNYCIAGCYSEFGEFKRTKHICGITKIKSKWVKKYWDDVENIKK